jgi:hypothetical protein
MSVERPPELSTTVLRPNWSGSGPLQRSWSAPLASRPIMNETKRARHWPSEAVKGAPLVHVLFRYPEARRLGCRHGPQIRTKCGAHQFAPRTASGSKRDLRCIQRR